MPKILQARPAITVMTAAEIQAARKARGDEETPLHETCWNLYVVYYAGDGEVMRKHVLHTHDAEDKDLAFDFWMQELADAPDDIRAVELVIDTQTLVKAAIKRDGEADGTVVYDGARNHG